MSTAARYRPRCAARCKSSIAAANRDRAALDSRCSLLQNKQGTSRVANVPAPYEKQSPYPGSIHRLKHAAALGQLVVLRCNYCRRSVNFLASDLASLLGPERDALDPPFPCSKCRRTDYLRVTLKLPLPGDCGAILVRRPGPVRRIQTWRTVLLGE
jgi:hypothetical protein